MDGQPRSIFATLWFRALLVVLVLGAVAAVAVPYVLDVVNPPAGGPMLAAPPRPPESGPRAPVPPAPAPPQPAAPMASGSPPASEPSAGAPAPAPPAAEGAPTSKVADGSSPPTRSDGAVASGGPAVVAESRAVTPPAGERRPAPPSVEPAKPVTKVEVERGGTWWVQVGAFRDAAAAQRVATRLREQNYPVQESVKRVPAATVAAAPTGDTSSDRYDVFVSGLAPAEIQSRLAAKGLAADAVAGGAVVKPSLPLRDAVALSRELAAEGLKVQVRRQGSADPGSRPPAAAESLYRVRVGAYPDRAAAQAVARELERRGYKPFLTRDGS